MSRVMYFMLIEIIFVILWRENYNNDLLAIGMEKGRNVFQLIFYLIYRSE